MEENLGRNSTDFVFDTSAFLSLESVNLLEQVLNTFSITTTPSVIKELEDFAQHEDTLGNIAQRILLLVKLFRVEEHPKTLVLHYVSQTDEELYNLTYTKNVPLITDDTKLVYHTKDKIRRAFSTIFLGIFVDAGRMTKREALNKLELMRDIRNWQDNIIYLSSKEELNNIKE